MCMCRCMCRDWLRQLCETGETNLHSNAYVHLCACVCACASACAGVGSGNVWYLGEMSACRPRRRCDRSPGSPASIMSHFRFQVSLCSDSLLSLCYFSIPHEWSFLTQLELWSDSWPQLCSSQLDELSSLVTWTVESTRWLVLSRTAVADAGVQAHLQSLWVKTGS